MESDVELVMGGTGAGKTSYVVAKVVDDYMKFFNERYPASVDYIKNYNQTHSLQLTPPPQRHVVFSDITITTQFPSMQSYDFSGFDFGCPNNFMPTKRLMPYGVYVFDEIWRYWPSKQNFSLPPWVVGIFDLRRHIQIKVYLIAHGLTVLHNDIRRVVNKFTLIKKAIHTYKIRGKIVKSTKYYNNARIIQTVFFGVKFDNENALKRYQDGEKIGEKFKYKHIGDIRDNYDPYNHAEDVAETGTDFEYNKVLFKKRPPAWDNYKKIKIKDVDNAEQ